MTYFWNYVRDMWEAFGKYFIKFFKDVSTFKEGLEEYGAIYQYYSPHFGVGGWIMFVLYYLVIVFAIAGFITLIRMLIRKLRKKGKNKEEKDN